jgi:DNA-binding CsgD family transcriptional regulator
VQRRVGDFSPPFDRLTLREREVLKLVSEGKSSREIAELLFISVRTVEHHRANLKKKLGIHRTAELTKYAIRMGYTSADVLQ